MVVKSGINGEPLPTLHPYGTRIIGRLVFYQHAVPNGTGRENSIAQNNITTE
jgi:hypothetical protein